MKIDPRLSKVIGRELYDTPCTVYKAHVYISSSTCSPELQYCKLQLVRTPEYLNYISLTFLSLLWSANSKCMQLYVDIFSKQR